MSVEAPEVKGYEIAFQGEDSVLYRCKGCGETVVDIDRHNDTCRRLAEYLNSIEPDVEVVDEGAPEKKPLSSWDHLPPYQDYTWLLETEAPGTPDKDRRLLGLVAHLQTYLEWNPRVTEALDLSRLDLKKIRKGELPLYNDDGVALEDPRLPGTQSARLLVQDVSLEDSELLPASITDLEELFDQHPDLLKELGLVEKDTLDDLQRWNNIYRNALRIVKAKMEEAYDKKDWEVVASLLPPSRRKKENGQGE